MLDTRIYQYLFVWRANLRTNRHFDAIIVTFNIVIVFLVKLSFRGIEDKPACAQMLRSLHEANTVSVDAVNNRCNRRCNAFYNEFHRQ